MILNFEQELFDKLQESEYKYPICICPKCLGMFILSEEKETLHCGTDEGGSSIWVDIYCTYCGEYIEL